ncbi:MAG TPA: hypothetical protein PL153_11265, partial [Tenuifilum sp.]|nr:hypothetical protein [Tenuifilum sp.]
QPSRLNAQWYAEASGGGVYNLPMPLTIYQDGTPAIRMTARFKTEPFTLPVYWDVRLGKIVGKRIFETEVIHHKLYLKNTTAETIYFVIGAKSTGALAKVPVNIDHAGFVNVAGQLNFGFGLII